MKPKVSSMPKNNEYCQGIVSITIKNRSDWIPHLAECKVVSKCISIAYIL